MKYVIGWIKLQPGKRDEFLSLLGPFTEKTQQEEGNDFFEYYPSSKDPDTVFIAEKFRSAEDHDLHHQTPQHIDIWGHIQRLGAEARFENIFADRVEVDELKFPL